LHSEDVYITLFRKGKYRFIADVDDESIGPVKKC